VAQEEQENKKPAGAQTTIKRLPVGIIALLLLIAVAVALTVWVCLPDDSEGWRPYTFDEELAALQAKYAIGDEENAAVIYNRLLENHDDADFEPDFLDPEAYSLTESQPWTGQDYPELAEWLAGHKDTIATLIEATRIRECRFPLDADFGPSRLTMRRLRAIRYWAYLLTRAANNDIGENRIDHAVEKYITLLGIATHTMQQPFFIELLVGIGLEGLAMQRINELVATGNITVKHLASLEKALSEVKNQWESDLERIVESKKLLTKNMLGGVAYEVNTKGKTRVSQDPAAPMRVQNPKLSPPQYWERKLLRASTIVRWFCTPRSPEKIADIVDRRFEKFRAMAGADFDWQKGPRDFSIADPFLNPQGVRFGNLIDHMEIMAERSFYNLRRFYLRTIAMQRGSLLMVALRRYRNDKGFWPELLGDVRSLTDAENFVDPLNGGDFVYRRTDDGFKLYSKGKNNVDENGESADADDWPIWPERSQYQKENRR